MSTTSWKEQDISDGFEMYNDILEWTLGYPFAFRWLELARPNYKFILDYGCGPGKVAYQLASYYQKNIIAVDESEAMLETARQKRHHPLIDYKLVQNDNLHYLQDNSIDGVMLCFVLLNLGSEKQINKILSEVYRVLKPGSPCVILDTDPASIGIKFSTFQSGIPNKQYNYGDEREARLFLLDGKSLELHGYHWPREMYVNALIYAAFRNVEHQTPTLNDASEKAINLYRDYFGVERRHAEQEYSPYILFRGVK